MVVCVMLRADRDTLKTFYLSQKCQIHCSKWGIGIYKGLVNVYFDLLLNVRKYFTETLGLWSA